MRDNVTHRWKALLVLGLLAALVLTVWVGPALAITWGEEDVDNRYANVGSIVVVSDTGVVSQICSGTYIGERQFLTAGHCTEILFDLFARNDGTSIDNVKVSFDHDNIFDGPFVGVEKIITHPDYGWDSMSNPHEVGMLILSKKPKIRLSPATLPELGMLDELKADGTLGRGNDKVTFTVVGYGSGLELSPPQYTTADGARYFAASEYRGLTSAWLLISQNLGDGDGGTCMGDSGGPAFLTYEGKDYLVGICSRGDWQCLTTGFDYRVDIAETLDFIAETQP